MRKTVQPNKFAKYPLLHSYASMSVASVTDVIRTMPQASWRR